MADQIRSTASDGTSAIVDIGKQVIRTEAAALSAMADALDDAFAEAVEIVLATPGRVILTGMGKSGHVARKIAATMASTGTPAYFVHPGEASHGDLGMVTRHDTVICLSNSGETSELADIMSFAALNQIKVIVMVGRAKSSMGDAADVALIVPPFEEACPNGLAPTTSTTMMLAMGDALAVALLEKRHFTADDFRRFHPGGKLGAKLLKVDDLMHRGDEMPVVKAGTRMSDALIVMTTKSLGCAGIVDDDGALAGLITDGDLRRGMEERQDLLAATVDDVMNRAPLTIESGTLAAEAMGEMNRRKITSLFVMDGDRPVGLLHLHDCLRTGIQ
ncbi:KpsF/GutQ family sugar-phosphate isomerase [Minwuia sp.]|uniref:KpsF/GutQ family sugar-phosphate isomerase n=1 Tax=Minwuia sp. TaxID=2493630 RepID=UPI003A8EAF22